MKIFSVCFFSLFLGLVTGQNNIVDWNYEISTQEGETYLKITGEIKTGWVIYSQHTDPEGPIPTSIELNESSEFSLEGGFIEETAPIIQHSELFDVEVKKFKDKVVFSQKLIGYGSGTLVSGTVEFMCCDKSRCLPPETISFEVKG